MKEMDHPAAIRDVDPALDQHGVGFAAAVFDDPITQAVSTHQIGVEMPQPIVMAVKSDIVALWYVVVGEESIATAEEHSRARRVAIARHSRAQTVITK